MNEHRTAPRRRIFKAGSISCGGVTIDCTVRSISDTGAALEVVTPLFIPDRFKLIIESAGLHRPCHVVCKQKRLGACERRWAARFSQPTESVAPRTQRDRDQGDVG